MSTEPVNLYHADFTEYWIEYSLYELAQWINGMAFKNIQFSSSGVPVIKIAEIKNGESSSTKYTRGHYDKKYWLSDGDMLFCWSGQPETSIGTYWWHRGDGWLNQHIFKVIPKKSVVTAGFLYQVLQYLQPNFVGISRNKQTTGLGHITQKDLKALRVSLPPLPEQRAIAATLGALDDKIESNQCQRKLLEGLAFSYYLSTSRRECHLSEVATLTMGLSPKSSTYNHNENGIPFYQGVADFGERFPGLRIWTTDPIRFAKPNDSLFSVRAPVGRLNRATGKCCIGRGVAAVHSDCPSTLFYALINAQEKWNVYNAEGTVYGSINKKELTSLILSWPESEALHDLEELLSAIDLRILSLHHESKMLASLRDILLPELMSGRIRVSEAKGIVEEATDQEVLDV